MSDHKSKIADATFGAMVAGLHAESVASSGEVERLTRERDAALAEVERLKRYEAAVLAYANTEAMLELRGCGDEDAWQATAVAYDALMVLARGATLALALACLVPILVHAQSAPPVLLATFYGAKFQGRRTASMEPYDVNKLTAAHRTLPFGTMLRVCRVGTDRCVVVRVNDRGIGKKFELDLTPTAFKRLAPLMRGVVRVTIEEVSR